MRLRSRLALAGAVCWLAAWVGTMAAAAAQNPPAAATPSVDEILAKYVKAVGGKEAFEKLNSRVCKGTFELEQMNVEATEEIDQKAPNKLVSITDIPNFGVVRSGFDGTSGWKENPQTGMQDVTGELLAQMKRGAEFYHEIKLKELYGSMTVKGKESVNGHDAWVVEAVPTDSKPEMLYFDADSGLVVRATGQTEGPNGPVDVDTTLSDYREVDGVKLPFEIHTERSDFTFTIKWTEVKHNVPVDDAKFAKPVAM
jgi:zinc protease